MLSWQNVRNSNPNPFPFLGKWTSLTCLNSCGINHLTSHRYLESIDKTATVLVDSGIATKEENNMRRSIKRDDCANCGTEDRKLEYRGLCTLCYRLTLKKEKSEGWKLDNPSTLKGYPFCKYPIDPRRFEEFKQNVILHYQGRLDYLKYREAKLKGDVDGLYLEYAFNHIEYLAGSKDHSLFHGLCGWFEMIFNPEQRRALLRIADKIEKEVHRETNIASLCLSANKLQLKSTPNIADFE
jgi:hypothetical protein